MRILGIESSALAASAAVLEDGRLLSESYLNTGLTHSQTLLRLVDTCLKNAELGLPEIDAAAVAYGPGSFTGVRIGVSLTKGLCFGRETPVYGISTLEAMAFAAALPGFLIAPVMDARCRQVYTAGFVKENGEMRRRFPDEALTLESLAARLRESALPPLLIGDGAALASAFLEENGIRHEKYPEILRFQRASAVAFAAFVRYNKGEAGIPAEALRPAYLRASQAERERLAREQNQKEGRAQT